MIGSTCVGSATSLRTIASKAPRVLAPFFAPKASQTIDNGSDVDFTK